VDTEAQEKRIQRLMMPIETQIMMCDDENDLVLLAVGMLRKTILLFDNQYQRDARKALINEFNQ
jgi:hypothetical protein